MKIAMHSVNNDQRCPSSVKHLISMDWVQTFALSWLLHRSYSNIPLVVLNHIPEHRVYLQLIRKKPLIRTLRSI